MKFYSGVTRDLKLIPTPQFADSIRRHYRRMGWKLREPDCWPREKAQAFDADPEAARRARFHAALDWLLDESVDVDTEPEGRAFDCREPDYAALQALIDAKRRRDLSRYGAISNGGK